MKLFYEKHIFFCTNLRKEKAKISCGKHKSQELRNYMKKKVKELGIKKVRVNSSGCLNRCKLGPIVVSDPEGNWYKISSKEDVDLFIEKKSSPKNTPVTPLICNKFFISKLFVSSRFKISKGPLFDTFLPGRNFNEFGLGVFSVCINIS